MAAEQKVRRYSWRRFLLGHSILTPRGLWVRARFFWIIFALLHLVGLRDYTMIFSGTFPATSLPNLIVAFGGVAYAFFYLAAVVVAPILLIAAALLWAQNTLIHQHY